MPLVYKGSYKADWVSRRDCSCCFILITAFRREPPCPIGEIYINRLGDEYQPENTYLNFRSKYLQRLRYAWAMLRGKYWWDSIELSSKDVVDAFIADLREAKEFALEEEEKPVREGRVTSVS